MFEINIPNYYTTSKRIYDTSILLCTSDQRNNSHEASSCWLGCIARKEEENPLEAHGYGRSRNWTSSRPSGIRLIKKVLLSPFSCERFFKWFPKDRITEGYCGIRLLYSLVVASERDKVFEFWSRCEFMPTLSFKDNFLRQCNFQA